APRHPLRSSKAAIAYSTTAKLCANWRRSGMVFPLGDDNSDRTSFPVVNLVFIAINVAVFVLFQGAGTNDAFTYAFSAVPEEIVTGRDLVTEDQIVRVETPAGVQQGVRPGLKRTPVPVFLTLFTSIFMH